MADLATEVNVIAIVSLTVRLVDTIGVVATRQRLEIQACNHTVTNYDYDRELRKIRNCI